jgi:hypothetical protein
MLLYVNIIFDAYFADIRIANKSKLVNTALIMPSDLVEIGIAFAIKGRLLKNE